MEVSLLGTSQNGYLNSNNKDSKKELNISIDILSQKTSQIEENPIKPKRKKASSSIRDVSESIRAPYVPPTIQQLHEIL